MTDVEEVHPSEEFQGTAWVFEMKNGRALEEHMRGYFETLEWDGAKLKLVDGWYLFNAEHCKLRGPFADEDSALEAEEEFEHWVDETNALSKLISAAENYLKLFEDREEASNLKYIESSLQKQCRALLDSARKRLDELPPDLMRQMTEVTADELDCNLFEVKNQRVLNDHANLNGLFDLDERRLKIAADGWYLLEYVESDGLLCGPFLDEESARAGAKDFAHYWREKHEALDEMPPNIQDLD